MENPDIYFFPDASRPKLFADFILRVNLSFKTQRCQVFYDDQQENDVNFKTGSEIITLDYFLQKKTFFKINQEVAIFLKIISQKLFKCTNIGESNIKNATFCVCVDENDKQCLLVVTNDQFNQMFLFNDKRQTFHLYFPCLSQGKNNEVIFLFDHYTFVRFSESKCSKNEIKKSTTKN